MNSRPFALYKLAQARNSCRSSQFARAVEMAELVTPPGPTSPQSESER